MYNDGTTGYYSVENKVELRFQSDTKKISSWVKSVRERQTLYVLSHMGNINNSEREYKGKEKIMWAQIGVGSEMGWEEFLNPWDDPKFNLNFLQKIVFDF